MDIEKLRKNAEAKGFSFKYFATAREAADYMVGELAGRSVGIGGSKTVDTLDIYDRLCAECPDVAWHWKQEPDGARERAAHSEAYVTSANGIAETGEIVNIDGNGQPRGLHALRAQIPLHSGRREYGGAHAGEGRVACQERGGAAPRPQF